MTRSDLQTFRRTAQNAREDLRGGQVTIAGREYAAAIHLGPVEFLPQPDGGTARGQRLRADIFKTKLTTPPVQKTAISHEGVEFKVAEVGGRNTGDVAWVIRGIRWMD